MTDLDSIEADLAVRERVGGGQAFDENLAALQGKRSGTSISDADRRVRAAAPALCAEVRQLRAVIETVRSHSKAVRFIVEAAEAAAAADTLAVQP